MGSAAALAEGQRAGKGAPALPTSDARARSINTRWEDVSEAMAMPGVAGTRPGTHWCPVLDQDPWQVGWGLGRVGAGRTGWEGRPWGKRGERTEHKAL